jgi:hypothetical protein
LVVEQDGYVSKREVFTLSGSDRQVVVILDREKKPEPVPSEPVASAREPEPVGVQAVLSPPTPTPAPGSETSVSAATAAPSEHLSKYELSKQKRSELRAARVAERYHARKDARAEGGSRSKSSKHAADGDSEPASEHAKSASGAMGVLKLNTIPWSEVVVDKKHVGHTPLFGLQLPAGHHTIEVTNPDTGARKKLKIQLHAGETLTKVEKLGS